MFRFALMALAFMGLGALLFGGAEGVGWGFGFLLLAPLFFFAKFLFFMMLFGAIGGAFWRRRTWDPSGAPWRRPRPAQPQEPEPAPEDQFDEWHRLAHAKEEVESWVPDFSNPS